MWETITFMPTVKAYPNLSAKYGEVVCIAGVRTDTMQQEWVRLYPVGYRDLPFAQRFSKYQLVTLQAERHGTDKRPETFRPNVDSIQLGAKIDTKKDWALRRQLVEPLIAESMCEILRRQEADGTSLGAFRPRDVLDLEITQDVDERSQSKDAIAAQPSLWLPTKDALEQVPLRFRYHYRCSTTGCNGHHQTIIDWELAQAWRGWRDRYDEQTLLTKLREKFLDEMCGPAKDTVFFVGNQHQHPKAFLVLGVFWPPVRGG